MLYDGLGIAAKIMTNQKNNYYKMLIPIIEMFLGMDIRLLRVNAPITWHDSVLSIIQLFVCLGPKKNEFSSC